MVEENQSAKDSLYQSSTSYGSIVTSKADANETSESKSHKKVKYTSTQWMTLITLAFACFCNGSFVSLIAPFFPPEAELKGATPTEYGLIFGFFQLTLFVMAPLMGKMVSFVSSKFLLNFGVLTLGVSCVAFGLLDYCRTTSTFVALAFAIRIIEGIGAAALRTSCFIIITSEFAADIGTIIASLETCLSVGLIIGPTMGGVLYDLGGYGLPFYIAGAIILAVAIFIFIFFPVVERKILPERENLFKFWLHPITLIFSLSIFSSFCILGFIQATLEPHIRQFELSGFYLGMIFALIGVAYGIFAPFWGWLCDHMSRSDVLSTLGSLLQIVSILIMGPAPFIDVEPAVYLVVLSIIIFGLGLSSKNVSAFTGMLKESVKRGLPQDLATFGILSTIMASSQSLGSFIGPSLGGFLSEEFGFRKASMVFLVLDCVLVLLFVCFHFTRSSKRKSLDIKQTT